MVADESSGLRLVRLIGVLEFVNHRLVEGSLCG